MLFRGHGRTGRISVCNGSQYTDMETTRAWSEQRVAPDSSQSKCSSLVQLSKVIHQRMAARTLVVHSPVGAISITHTEGETLSRRRNGSVVTRQTLPKTTLALLSCGAAGLRACQYRRLTDAALCQAEM